MISFNSLAVLTPPTLVFCPQLSPTPATFTCKTTTGALLWIQGNHQHPFTSTSMVGDTGSLGYFTTRLDSVEGMNYTSTATTDVFSLPSNSTNITITCDDNGDAIGGKSSVVMSILGTLFFFAWFVLFEKQAVKIVIIHQSLVILTTSGIHYYM